MRLPLSTSFVQDLAAMGFEAVPVAANADYHDFQRNAILIRFWENASVRAAWSHIVYAQTPGTDDDLYYVVAHSGSGLARLAVYLHGGR